MSKFVIKEEDIKKAYEEGSSEIKKMFETLIPDLFKVKFPCVMKNPKNGLIVYMIKESNTRGTEGCGYVLDPGKECYYAKHRYLETWFLSVFVPIKDFKITE